MMFTVHCYLMSGRIALRFAKSNLFFLCQQLERISLIVDNYIVFVLLSLHCMLVSLDLFYRIFLLCALIMLDVFGIQA